MFDLAAKKRNYIAPDIIEYIKRDYVSSSLRAARDLDATEEDWVRFAMKLRNATINVNRKF